MDRVFLGFSNRQLAMTKDTTTVQKSQNKLLIVYVCTILTLCTLYAVQPIQPLFEAEFSLTRFQAVIFTTVIMLPLGIAPIAYGYLLETFSSKRLLRFSILWLGILEICFAFSDTYWLLLSIRGLQGLVIPAILTSLMSYISFMSPRELVQKAIGVYIGSTIVGGFAGRFFSGLFSDMFGWRFFFALLGVLLFVMFWMLRYVDEDVKINFAKPQLSQISKVLHNRAFLLLYLSMFCIFFVFQGVLNFLPFWLNSFSAEVSHSKVGLVYAGYIVGFVISLKVLQIIKFFGSETRSMFIGGFIYLLGVQIFHLKSYGIIFGGMFVFCAGMFIVHSIASGYINKLAETNKAISNGLYLSFYYAGGTLGTFIPGFFYEKLGWDAFLHVLSGVIVLGLFLLLALKLHVRRICKHL
ncbi:MAG: MFS transporter [Sulfurospirillaceae bacterium]|nr:MFS transporter [Sulfurospirillaceae bacterium]